MTGFRQCPDMKFLAVQEVDNLHEIFVAHDYMVTSRSLGLSHKRKFNTLTLIFTSIFLSFANV